MHPPTQVAVAFGPEGQVKVIRHQAVGKHSHADPSTCLPDETNEGVKIAVAMKNFSAQIASIENMVAITALGTSRRAWHGDYCYGFSLGRQEKIKNVPVPDLGTFLLSARDGNA
jgi:hypothetical protein